MNEPMTEDGLRKRFSWSHAVGEIALIVVGVTIALAGNSWYEGYEAEIDEHSLLEELSATLSEDLQGVLTELATIRQVNEDLRAAAVRLQSGDLHSSDGANQAAITALGRFVVVTIRNGPFETLKARGLDLISNQALRVSLTSLYEDEFPRLKENSEIDQRLSRERVLPYQLDYFNLDADQNWVVKSDSPEARARGATLARYRSETLVDHYIPSFERTISLMRDTLAEIDRELGA